MHADLCVVSGGLGPTHDDRTVEFVARAAGVGLRLDEELHAQIGGISRAFAERLGRPYVDFETGVQKQATIPEGAISLGLAGTAPGLVLEHGETVVVVLPGPPSELQRLWAVALESEPVRRVLGRTRPPELRQLRFFGASESTVAKALADAGGDGDGVEATICARDFEIHVDLVVAPGAEARADELTDGSLRPSSGTSSAATSVRSRSSCSTSAASRRSRLRPRSRVPAGWSRAAHVGSRLERRLPRRRGRVLR